MAKTIDKKASIDQNGTSKNCWGVGNGTSQETKICSFQPGFDPYISFDPTTGWAFKETFDGPVKTFASLKSPLVYDFSVNSARAYVNMHGHILLESSIQTNSAGNFNGGGTGNKPIGGVDLLGGLPFNQLPRLLAEVKINTTDELGLSYNIFVDLLGNGDPADVAVIDVTNTLNSVVDKYAKSGAEASVTDFDVNQFTINAPGSSIADMDNVFYIVGMGGGPTSAFYTGGTVWFENPINLAIFESGGTMPVTGESFSGGFPNAKLVACAAPDLSGAAICIPTDGGMPHGTPVTPITLQIGGSSNNARVVTEITELKIGDEVIV